MRAALFSRSCRALFCLTLLLGALTLRLGFSDCNEPLPETAPAQTEPSPTEASTEEPAAPEEAPAGPAFSPGEAEGISIRSSCSYEVDRQALLLSPLPFSLPKRPTVLILHTHTTEAYSPESSYAATGAYHTLDETQNLLAVGDALEEALEQRGIGVIHERKVHDYPDYNASYTNAKATLEAELAAHPEVVLVLDLHRDAMDVPVRESVTLEGADCAKLMFVVGTDEGGLYHPFWQENLSVALKLQALLNRDWPELCRPLNLRKERFNGQASPGALLIEVGSTGNTLEEARRSMPYLAEAIKTLLGQ